MIPGYVEKPGTVPIHGNTLHFTGESAPVLRIAPGESSSITSLQIIPERFNSTHIPLHLQLELQIGPIDESLEVFRVFGGRFVKPSVSLPLDFERADDFLFFDE